MEEIQNLLHCKHGGLLKNCIMALKNSHLLSYNTSSVPQYAIGNIFYFLKKKNA